MCFPPILYTLKSVYNKMNIVKTIIEAIKGTETDYTKGDINRAIILLSIPMIIEMLGESLFSIVDAYYVSQVSNEAFATVILTEAVASIIYSLAIGISIAATALVARRIGEKNPKLAAEAAAQAILIALVVSFLITLVGIFFSAEILALMGATPAVIEEGLLYTQIILGFNLVIMLLFILNGIFRGAGDASVAMRSLWVANIINLTLDPILIFGWGPFPEMGVVGAAVATTIGRGLAVCFQIYILFKGSSIIKLVKAYFRPKAALLKKLTNIALTGAGQHIISSASWIFLMYIVAKYGTDVVNGYGLAIKYIVLAILPAWGIANAGATLMGQNLGAKEPDRASKSVWLAALYNGILLLTVAIFYYNYAEPLIRLFNNDPNVVAVGVESLQIFSLGYAAYGVAMVINQAFSGAGDTRTPTVVNIFTFWIVQIPLAYYLSTILDWGPTGVYWAVISSETMMMFICIWLFRQGSWRTVEV